MKINVTFHNLLFL